MIEFGYEQRIAFLLAISANSDFRSSGAGDPINRSNTTRMKNSPSSLSLNCCDSLILQPLFTRKLATVATSPG
jgi:hypothetical protein